MKRTAFLLAGLALMMVLDSCRKDKAENIECDGSNPTYDGQIRAIINSNCASNSCHPGYSSYEGLEGILQNGRFEREVLIDQTMPRNGNLSAGELSKIKCWVENGFPED
ncbi:MAG TPA: hypothetical protein DCF33_18435 [Saprospirales bacterium]|nr:hypothetical protein [Saprospirales bacterium]